MKQNDSGIDHYDLKIIKTLAKNGYIKNAVLAESIGLSPSACHQRVARLKKIGLIKGYLVEFDLSQIASNIRVMTLIMLERQRTDEYNRMNAEIVKTPEIVRAHRVSGQYDYALEAVACNYEHYRQIIERLLNSGVEVKQYQSKIMQQNIKSKNAAEIVCQNRSETL
ncbi:MAG: Lrp/AsnC family transcriptional regulator [Pseudomonadota bacterium]